MTKTNEKLKKEKSKGELRNFVEFIQKKKKTNFNEFREG